MQFKKASFLLVLTLTGIFSVVADEPTSELPLEVGKSYRITLASKDINVGFINSNASTVKILRLFRYPWVEIEITWTPSVAVNEAGESVEPSSLKTRTFFNLDHAAAITPATEIPPAGDTGSSTELLPSPTDVVKQFFSAVESADKEKVLFLIADYPEKEKKFASSSLGRHLETPSTSRKSFAHDFLDAKMLGDAAVVLVGEKLSERDYDIDPVFLVRRSGEWKIAPGIYYPVLPGDAKTWGHVDKFMELKESLFDLAKWAGAAIKEGNFASSKDEHVAEQIVLGKPVSTWIELLRDPDDEKALYPLIFEKGGGPPRAKGDAVPMLISMLSHSDDSVRFGAAAVLGRIGEHARPAVPVLRAALEDRSTLVRLAAANALWQIAELGDEAIPVLVDSLKSKDPKTRRTSIYYLSRTFKHGVPYLVPALNSDDPHWRRAAARAIRQIWQESHDRLVGVSIQPPSPRQQLKSPDPQVRSAAWSRLLDRPRGQWPDAQEVVPHLVTALKSDDKELRQLATAALSLMGPPAKDSITVLHDLLETDDRNLRWYAIRALDRIGPDASLAVPRLREMLADDDRYIRWAAADALDVIAPGGNADERRQATADRPTVENDQGDRFTLLAVDPPPPATLEPDEVVRVEFSCKLQSGEIADIWGEPWRGGNVVRTGAFNYGTARGTKDVSQDTFEFGFHQAADIDQLRCKMQLVNAPTSLELSFDLRATWEQPD